jgi:4-amino-4-deoxy-L-arabinose transferase-like glycosyltransferase
VSRARALVTRFGRFWGAVPVALIVALLALRACVATDPLSHLARGAVDPADPPGTIVHVGSIDIARGGPVKLGFYSPGPARLTVAQKPGPVTWATAYNIRGQGLYSDRVVIEHGVVGIRFAAAPGARLLWSPVGRRGELEYVPASVLSPHPPQEATFGATAGANLLDGFISLAILVIVCVSLCILVRRRLFAIPRDVLLAMAGVFAIALAARWIDLGGFGQTWDEDVNWSAGRNYITNLLDGNFARWAWQWNFEHPPVMKYLAGIGAQFADGFGPARALSAVWLALGCSLLVAIGARLFSLRIAILAGGIAALLPPLVAHGQIVGHESPTVLWWLLAAVLALGLFDRLDVTADKLDRPTLRALRIRLAWLGVAIGVAVASRFVNALVGPLCAAVIILQAPRPLRRIVVREAAWLLPLAAAVTLYALWPRLWLHPFAALGESFDKLKKPHSAEPFLGATTNQPGPHYFLVYLVATLPIAVLAGAIWGGVRSARARVWVPLLLLVIPLGVMFSPVRQDGVRYVMPSVAALALLAAVGWDHAAQLVERRYRFGFHAVAAALGLYLAITLARIHPYYLDYFGEQVGGPGTVARHGWFETAWWGEGVADAVEYVNDHAAPAARVFRDCIEPYHLAWFREDLWNPMVHDPRAADWIIAYAPASHGCPIPRELHRVYEVTAGGAVLAAVYARQ